MIKRNPCFERLFAPSIYPEVESIIEAFKKKNPHAALISLSVGDTSQPLSPVVANALKTKAEMLATPSGYRGYGPECGERPLREKITEILYDNQFVWDEIYISDGVKCDIGRLQVLFGSQVSVAVQDPSYPIYVDTSHLMGQRELIYLPCDPENNFFPSITKSDLLFFCSPNNPTGVAASREELKELVYQAKKNKTIIIYDAAYSHFISNPNYPRSIYEIEGAKDVAIELNSFSKLMGFTGVRLGWSVVPHQLKYASGEPIYPDWIRVILSFFNGASNISQAGGIGALTPQGLKEINTLASFYMENTRLLKNAFLRKGYTVYGGDQCPYLWVKTAPLSSWDFFYDFLEQSHLITFPGVGFGPKGEGFARISAFGKREEIQEAIKRIEAYDISYSHTAHR